MNCQFKKAQKNIEDFYKKFNTNNRAQGTIEYLIIIAIVIVISLVLISIIFGLSNINNISENDAKLKWKTSTDWAITDWYSSPTQLTIVLKNNSNSNLTLNFVTINDTNNNTLTQKDFIQGEEKTLIFNKNCTKDFFYNSIEISYSSSLILNRKQISEIPILGKCPN